MHPSRNNIAAYVKVGDVGIDPQLAGAGALTGTAIQRVGSGYTYDSAVLVARCGIETGSPTALTLDFKLQDSADGATGWADVTGAAIAQQALQCPNSRVVTAGVNLAGAKAYVRGVATVAFTGGSSPTLPVAFEIILGGGSELPAA